MPAYGTARAGHLRTRGRPAAALGRSWWDPCGGRRGSAGLSNGQRVTTERLEAVLARLARSKDRILGLVAAADDSRRAVAATDGQWSMLQVIEHLVLAEEGTLRVLRRGPPAKQRVTLRSRLILRAIELLFTMGARVRVPSQSLAPSGGVSLEALRVRWSEARDGIVAVVMGLDAQALQAPRFRHPVAGWLTVEQGLDFLERHIRHHERQIQRIRQATSSSDRVRQSTSGG